MFGFKLVSKQYNTFNILTNNGIQRFSNHQNDVITHNIGNKGVIILNRPEVLNAFNLSMAKKIYSALKEWESNKTLVIVKGVNGKAFSVGGDISTMVKSNLMGGIESQEIFKYQYIIKKLVASYKIPYVSFIDGLVMGSAMSLSFLGQYCVVTERTLFAMPETRIGLIPDGGSSYILPKLSNRLGWYLALTGHRLKASDIIKAGITKYYCKSEDLNCLERELLLSSCKENSIKTILEKFNKELKDEFSLTSVIDKINHCFSAQTVEELISKLEKDQSKWAEDTIQILNKMCPTSLKVTLRELELGRQLNIHDCLQMEYRLAMNCLKNKNFREGVRALLIDKDHNPKWNPPTLSRVSNEFVESHFSKVPQEEELQNRP